MTNSNLVEITKIATNNNEQLVSDIAEISNDFDAFYEKHKKWFDEDMEYEDDIEDSILEIFVFWLERRGADKNQFASHIDWKESPKEIIRQLGEINKNLGYPLNINELEIDESEDTFEALKIINKHFSAKGFNLIGLDSGADCYYLFIVPAKEFGRLQKLGGRLILIFLFLNNAPMKYFQSTQNCPAGGSTNAA